MLQGCTPWPDDLAAEYRRLGLWEGLTIAEMVARGARRWPDKTALVQGERRWTYGELVDASRRLAAGFAAHGLAPRERVVLQLPNIAEFAITYLALQWIGAVPVMALRAHRHAELRHFIGASGATAYVIADRVGNFDYTAMATQLQAEFPALRQVWVAGTPAAGQQALAELMDEASPADVVQARLAPRRPDPSEVATMLLSGGTTSLSKLIPRTHDDYVLNARLCGQAAGFGPDTVFLALLPLGHNYNLASPGLLGSWYHGRAWERVMGFCTHAEYDEFLRQVPEFERQLVRSGVHVFKFWFSVSRAEQRRRFKERQAHPLKQWKLSRSTWPRSTSGTTTPAPRKRCSCTATPPTRRGR